MYVSILNRKKCRLLKEQGWKARLPFSGVIEVPKFWKFREILSEKGNVAKRMLQFQNIFYDQTKLQRFKVSQNPTHPPQCRPCLPFNQDGV